MQFSKDWNFRDISRFHKKSGCFRRRFSLVIAGYFLTMQMQCVMILFNIEQFNDEQSQSERRRFR